MITNYGFLVSLNAGFGTYGLEIVVTTIYGNSITAEFTLQVIEDISPSWMVAPEDQTLFYGESFNYRIHAVDNVGISMWTLNDTLQFSID